MIQIDCPVENQPATVVVTGSGGLGHIAARGIAFGSRANTPYERVWARVFEGSHGSGSPAVPLSHPPAPDVTPTGGQTDWYFAAVPGARCDVAGSGAPQCTLVIWAKFTGVAQEERGFAHFHGVCGDTVSCDPPGSGSAAKSGGGLTPSVALDLAPAVWSVAVAGFGAGKSRALNGTWLLLLRGPQAGRCVWDNGGDGRARPLVQLCCETPLAVLWQLSFRHGDRLVVLYRRAATEWNPLGGNVLARQSGRGPAFLTVQPG